MPLARGTERASHITALISSVAALAQVCNLILTNTEKHEKRLVFFVVPIPLRILWFTV